MDPNESESPVVEAIGLRSSVSRKGRPAAAGARVIFLPRGVAKLGHRLVYLKRIIVRHTPLVQLYVCVCMCVVV